MHSMMSPAVPLLALAAALLPAPLAWAQQVQAEAFMLDNGMTFLLVPRKDQPNNIAAGWLAKVGSVNERPGITGISHFFEHMMFKGTKTIGTTDAATDARFTAKQKTLKDQLNALTWGGQYQRHFKGEIDDPWNPANDTDEMRRLRAELKQAMDEHRGQIVKNEFDAIYKRLGGTGMNAFTSYDLTFYFINVPSNKFELWAWMESDRLNDSVFREFYAERDVVHEERRLRTESTPTGEFQEQFDSMFWISSPYNWPVIGWSSDLNSYSREEAERYWNIYYRPNNLVGFVVGDFDAAEVKAQIGKYFSRLSRGAEEPPPVITLEVKQKAEQRMIAECDCQPQAEVRYHTVPFGHVDSAALETLAEVLNGRTGRLYKAMVEGGAIAASAAAKTDTRKYAGAFSFDGIVKGDAAPEQLEQGWYAELEKLKKEPVGERELQKVKNQVAADSYRRLQNNFFLLVQLGLNEAMGDWTYINQEPRLMQAVTAADIQRVANTYFGKDNRSVALYYRKAGGIEDPELAAIDPVARGQVKTMLKQLLVLEDANQLRMIAGRMSQQVATAPPEYKAALEYVQKKLQQRIAELDARGGAKTQ
jgi:predicted Zn-dependent peptidase